MRTDTDETRLRCFQIVFGTGPNQCAVSRSRWGLLALPPIMAYMHAKIAYMYF